MRTIREINTRLTEVQKNGNPVLIYAEVKRGCSLRIDRDQIVLFIIVSWGRNWDHVSVHTSEARPPTWDEMCFIKNIFFGDNECVVQYHPPKDKYKNLHPYCLHLWKSQRLPIPQPPVELV